MTQYEPYKTWDRMLPAAISACSISRQPCDMWQCYACLPARHHHHCCRIDPFFFMMFAYLSLAIVVHQVSWL
jgi:hypothetical protein